MYFQRHAYKQNFEVLQQRQPRQHSQSRPIQHVHFNSTAPHAVLQHRQPMNEVHHLNNIPYTGLANIQVYPTYGQPLQQTQPADAKEEPIKFRPPSSNVSYRPLIPTNLSTTPRSNNMKGHVNGVAQSRERSTDENSEYFSNTIHDTSDTLSMKGKVVSKNGLKTVMKPNIPLGKNQSLEKNKENCQIKQLRSELERVKAKCKNYDDVLRQKQTAVEEVARLRRQLQHRDREKEGLQQVVRELHTKGRGMENELGALKSTVSLYEDEAKRFKVKLSTTRQQNFALKEQLNEMKRQVPDMLQRFQRLEQLNSELQQRIRNDQEEWQEEKSKLEASTISNISRK